MKLWQVPRNSVIKYSYENREYILDFDHVDGMYSVCYLDGKLVHLPANTDVEVLHRNSYSGSHQGDGADW